jgi:hypothetical protein
LALRTWRTANDEGSNLGTCGGLLPSHAALQGCRRPRFAPRRHQAAARNSMSSASCGWIVTLRPRPAAVVHLGRDAQVAQRAVGKRAISVSAAIAVVT